MTLTFILSAALLSLVLFSAAFPCPDSVLRPAACLLRLKRSRKVKGKRKFLKMTKLKKSTKKFLKNKLQHKQPAKKALPPAKSKSKRKPLAKAKAKVPGSQDPEQQQQQQLLQDDAYNLGILSDEEGDDDDDALDSLDDADHQVGFLLSAY